jgi:hypothetical protein
MLLMPATGEVEVTHQAAQGTVVMEEIVVQEMADTVVMVAMEV